MVTWTKDATREYHAPGLRGWVLISLRALVFALITLVLFLPFVLLRRLDNKRPSDWLSLHWKRIAMWFCGLKLTVVGRPMQHPGAFVSNHASWMDPLVLGAATPMQFVSKSEVANWPGIGILTRVSGVVFIDRRRSQAGKHQSILSARLAQGERLCFFPEGTSTDGLRVLPFKSTLFQVFLEDETRDVAWVQPVSLIYKAREGLPKDFFGWWGSTGFGEHAVQVLAHSWRGEAIVVFHEALRVADFADRKALAQACEKATREGFLRYVPESADA